ncbi:MAG TPA: plastocyanin/azurin family copper-binding protein [Thermoleophilaceae bacterium]|nr:plastocyanin/azurin family copper-binding protein [Thermoleophilaceae bacterium]
MKRTFVVPVAAACAALAFAGCGSSDDEGDTSGSASTPPPSETETTTSTAPSGGAGAGETLKLSADPSGQLKFDKDSLTAKAGKVTLQMDNPSSVPHAVSVEGNGVDEDGETVGKGGVSKVSVDLKPGKYEFYCPVDGHEQAGMKGDLTVK